MHCMYVYLYMHMYVLGHRSKATKVILIAIALRCFIQHGSAVMLSMWG